MHEDRDEVTQRIGDRPVVASVGTLRVEVVSGPDRGATAVAEEEQLAVGTAEGNALVLADPTVSRFHLAFTHTPRGILVVDRASTNGTRMSGVRIERAYVEPGAVLEIGRTTVRIHLGTVRRVEASATTHLAGMIGQSEVMRRLFTKVRTVAGSRASVLLHGESGTGKELVAKALHELGGRTKSGFVVVDCAALPENLALSELFGHERGAFTGADRTHVGAFERAHGGTLFLDEVGELSPALQSHLLGVLERRTFRRVGGTRELPTDVRVISASHRDLQAAVNAGRFRLDLYYRLAVLTLDVPPLRDRPDDIAALVEHFLRRAGDARSASQVFGSLALARMESHDWPGNVRELRNYVEAAMTLGPHVLSPARATPRAVRLGGDPTTLPSRYKDARAHVLESFERGYLAHWLTQCDGNVSLLARSIALDRAYLTQLLKRHGIGGVRPSDAP